MKKLKNPEYKAIKRKLLKPVKFDSSKLDDNLRGRWFFGRPIQVVYDDLELLCKENRANFIQKVVDP